MVLPAASPGDEHVLLSDESYNRLRDMYNWFAQHQDQLEDFVIEPAADGVEKQYAWIDVYNYDNDLTAPEGCIVALDRPLCDKQDDIDHLLFDTAFVVREATRADCGKLAVLFKPLRRGYASRPTRSCAVVSGIVTAQIRFPVEAITDPSYAWNCQANVDERIECDPFSVMVPDVTANAGETSSQSGTVTPGDNCGQVCISGDLIRVSGSATFGGASVTITTAAGTQVIPLGGFDAFSGCVALPAGGGPVTVSLSNNSDDQMMRAENLVLTQPSVDPNADPCKFTPDNNGPVTVIWPRLEHIRASDWVWPGTPTLCISADGTTRACNPGETPTHYLDDNGNAQYAYCCYARVRMQGDCRVGGGETCDVITQMRVSKDGCNIECLTEAVECTPTTPMDCTGAEITIDNETIEITSASQGQQMEMVNGNETIDATGDVCPCWTFTGTVEYDGGPVLTEITVNGTVHRMTAPGDFSIEFTPSSSVDYELKITSSDAVEVEFTDLVFSPNTERTDWASCLSFQTCEVIKDVRVSKDGESVECQKRTVIVCDDDSQDCVGIEVCSPDNLFISAAEMGDTEMRSVSLPTNGNCEVWTVTADVTMSGDATLTATATGGGQTAELMASGTITLECVSASTEMVDLNFSLENTGQSSATATISNICMNPVIDQEGWETCFPIGGGINNDEKVTQNMMDIMALKECLCETLVPILEDAGATSEQIAALEECLMCEDDNPVNEDCPDCPVPQRMNVDVSGSFPFSEVTGGFPPEQFLRFSQGAVQWFPDNAATVQAAFEDLIGQQWNFDSGGGCNYSEVCKTSQVGIAGEFREFNAGTTAVDMTELEICATLGFNDGTLQQWGFAVSSITATFSDGTTMPLATPNGDMNGPQIFGHELACGDRGAMPELFANSGGQIDTVGTGLPYVEWILNSITMSQP